MTTSEGLYQALKKIWLIFFPVLLFFLYTPTLRNYSNYNPAQTCITNQHHSISSDSSTWNFPRTVSRSRPIDPRPNILTPAISQNRFAPLSIELENTWKNNNSDNQCNYDRGTNSYIEKQSNHILQRSNANAINTNKRPDICITEKYVKKFTPTTILGNSTYSGIAKHGHKICMVGHSHIKRIKRNDFNKKLRHSKDFSVPLVVQILSSYVIISFPL